MRIISCVRRAKAGPLPARHGGQAAGRLAVWRLGMTIELRDEATKQVPCLPATAGKRQAGSPRHRPSGGKMRVAWLLGMTIKFNDEAPKQMQGRRDDNKTKRRGYGVRRPCV